MKLKNNIFSKPLFLLVMMNSCSFADVSGTVFRDYNLNTIQDILEPGIKGIKVTVYPDGISTTTAADGSWSLNTTSKVRVEFSNLPNYLKDSVSGNTKNSSVRFANNGDTINFAVHNPAEYIGGDVKVIATTVVGGSTTDAGSTNLPTIRAFDYNPTAKDNNDNNVLNLTTAGSAGNLWGLAYSKDKKVVYASEYLRRHAGVSSDDIGAIYSVDVSNLASPTTTLFTTINNAGSVPGNRDLGTKDDASHDPDVLSAVAKVGLGDLDISEDEKKLYTINLNTQELVEINIATKSQTAYSIENPFGTNNCPDVDVHSWAVKPHDGVVYIGSVCGSDVSVGASVSKWDGSEFTTIFTTPLTYDRGNTLAWESSSKANWKAWVDALNNGQYDQDPRSSHRFQDAKVAQPILSDIEFTEDSGMILGFIDRVSFMTGYRNYAPESGNTNTYEYDSGGDTLRVCKTGDNSYVLEGDVACPQHDDNDGDNDGIKEFFNGDFYAKDDGGTPTHAETSLGGLVHIQGTTVVATSSYDSVNAKGSDGYNRSGVSFLSMNDGNEIGGRLLNGDGTNTGTQGGFGKTGGMGDLELLSDPAPIEVGDRVWEDSDADGVQDADEVGISDVTVELVCGGAVVSSATTDADGNYIFSNDPSGTSTASHKYNVTALVANSNDCLVRVPNVSGTNKQASLGIRTLTVANNGEGSNANSNDSDGLLNGDNAEATISAGDIPVSGANNHSFDFGFSPKVQVSIGSLIWEDLNKDGLQDDAESGIADANVTLLDENGTVMTTPAMITTGADGKYYFSGLDEGSYSVRVTLPSSMGYVPCGTQVTADNENTENDSNIKTSVDNVHTSGQFTLQGDTEPVESNGKSGTDDADDADDDNGNMTVDFCFYRPASLGDYVWKDSDKDGIQDAGEEGVSGVTVKLLTNCDAATVAGTTSTDADGKYLFSGLDAGDYCVEFSDLPADYIVTTKGSGTATDSDAQTSAPHTTASTHLDPGENDMTWDMGIYSSKASIGDFVWYDNNANGVQDAGESGVNGIDVKLLDATCSNELNSTTTDANGFYSFTRLNPDTYCLEFGVIPNGYAITQKDSGADTTDSDVDPQTHKTIATTLDEGEDDMSWDMGIYPLAEIGDRVWDDENANGIQDATESGVAGVTATLYGSDCITRAKGVDGVTDVPTVSTSAAGEYKFTELPVGDYCVGFSNIPNGYKVTPQDQGGDDATDSDVKVDTNRTVVTTLDANESDMRWDMGIFKPATIGDKVWNDTNANGIQDGTEVGVKDVTVTLYDSSCNVVATDENGANIPTQTTDNSGNYLFTDLPPADYCLGFTNIPAGYAITPQDKGGDDATDSDVNVTTAKTVVTTLDPGEDDRTWDMGIYQEASIGNFVWNDINGNGEQEGAEVGVEDVTVTLYKADCATVATTNTGSNIAVLKTDANGLYKFEHLMPAEYCLGFTTLPNGFGFTFKDTASDLKDSDVDAATAKTISTVLDAGEDDMTWDAGIFESASIGDKVWYDNDANGIQDTNEKGVANVTVTLYKSDCTTVAVNGLGVVIPNTKTATDGSYSFSKLVPSDYCVGFNLATLPAGYKATFKDQGADDAKDSDANDRTGKTTSTNLVGGENDTTWDMGIYPLAEIGDKVWNDVNANGVQDSGESGVSNVTVTLYGADCTARAKGIDGVTDVPTTNTSASGEYKFIDLSIGSYCVGFTNLPNGFEITSQDRVGDDTIDSDARLNTAKTIVTTLDVNESDMSWDMGIYQPATIGDKVWNDSNANGIQDATEVGVKDVTVTLYDSSCTVVATDIKGAKVPSQKTDTDGNYLFSTLPPADYCLGFTTLPAGYAITPEGKGGDRANDSDVNVKTAKTVVTTLSPGEDDRTWDMGIYEEASIGNYVWNDINGNGKQENTEVGVSNVTVTLFQADCTTVAITNDGTSIATLKTDANGLYKFEHLMPAEYCLGFTTLPEGFGFTGQDTVEDASDSDVGKTTGKTISTVLDAGEDDMTWDAGIFESASIGDKVWYDNNANGVQEADEKGVANVSVTLYQADCTTVAIDGLGTIVPDAKTTANGNYMFSGLVPGDYCVGFNLETLPNGYKVTALKVANTTVDKDSNANKYGKTESTNLLGGEDDKSWDMGIYKPATIGNFVWLDKDADGVQDENEGGVANVTVRLYSGDCTTVIHTDSSGVVISPVVTGDNGLYEFNNLVPAEYCVGFEGIPTNYVVSPINQGNDLADSDVNPASKKTISTLLESGEHDQSWDMGLYIPATIGDRVWIDTNADGIQDKNESGIAGVMVTLYEGDCRTAVVLDNDRNEVTPITTDSDGFYNFLNLTPNDYCIGFSNLPEGYLISSQDVGTENNDSDADIVTARTVRTTLSSGENDGSWDMGIYRPASIGDRVWNDLDGNGEQDSGEEGVADVNVTLYNCDCTTIARDKNGTVIPSTLTDENGLYSFSNLTPNNYCLGFTVPTGYIASAQNSGEDDTKDSDVNADTNRTECTRLSSDENDTSWDMGIIIPASIGDRVWIDANRDGAQDSNESGLKDVNVTLYEADCSTAIKSMLTGKKGNYLFSDLLPNSYCIGIETPNGYAITPMDASEDSKDSDVNEETGRTIVTTLESGENDLTWDAGLYELSSIGDYVWFDEDHDGIQDSNETAVPNVKVILYESDCETEIKVTRSGTNGHYLFENLEPAEYCVGFDELPIGYQFTPNYDNTGAGSELDCNVDPGTGKTPIIELAHATNDLTWDMGIIPKCKDEEGRSLQIFDDVFVASTTGPVTTLDVLENDFGNLDVESIEFVTSQEAAILWENGTAVGGVSLETVDRLVVPGEGVWEVKSDGTITFTAEVGFDGVPTPVYYVVRCKQGSVSNIAQATITGNCVCETYSEQAVDTMTNYGMFLMLILSSTLALLLFRKEFE